MATLIKQIKKTNVKIRQNIFVSKILKDENGNINGLYYVSENMPNQEWFVKGKAVILATGAGAFIALQAGAYLKDMEFIQFTATWVVYPEGARA